MENNFQIVITGASGFVARNIRKHLSEKNIQLVSISRKNFKKLKNEIKIVSSDYEEKLILPKIQNSKALIHLVGIGKETIEHDYNLINVEFTKKIVNLCKKSNIKKIIFTSGLGVSKKTTLSYFISKYRAEKEIIESGIEYTIFRPSFIVGKNDHFTKNLKKQIKKGEILIPGSGNYTIQPIYIDDVLEIFRNSIINKRFKNKILDLVGPESITFENYVKLFCMGTRTKIKKINLETAYREAISNHKGNFALDDLNLLIGDFKGNHSELQRFSKISLTSIVGLLKSGTLF